MNRTTDQYRIITAGAGWHDRRARGRLRIEGRDAATFLHALVSNDVEALRKDRGTYAVYLTPQGRMIADLRIYHRGDHLLLDVPPGHADALAARLDRLVFSEDVRIIDVTDSVGQLGVVGSQAALLLASALGCEVDELEGLEVRSQFDCAGAIVARGDDAVLPHFDVFVAPSMVDDLVTRLGARGVAAIDSDLVEALRIEAGRPAFGVDMTEETIPLEAGLLERAISQTKGCYVGQEVIIRVLHRGGGRVAKRLVRLDVSSAAVELPEPGAPMAAEGAEIGHVTSAAWSPVLGCGIALGYVRREYAEPGRHVSVKVMSGSIEATVAALAS